MTIIFDKGTAKERSLPLDFFSEQVFDNRLSGYYNKPDDLDTPFPNIGNFERDFSTVEVSRTGSTIPLQNTYNTITDLTAHYDDSNRVYGLNVTLGVKAV